MTHPYIEIAEDFEDAIRENEKRKRNPNFHGLLVHDDIIARWRERAKESRHLANLDNAVAQIRGSVNGP